MNAAYDSGLMISGGPIGSLSYKWTYFDAFAMTILGEDAIHEPYYVLFQGEHVGSDKIQRLVEFHEIEVVAFDVCELESAPLEQLRELPNLRILNFRRQESLTDRDVAWLNEVTGLEYASFSHTGVGDKTTAALGRMPRLTFIGLNQTQTTDEGVRHLSRLRELESLELEGTAITGRGFGDFQCKDKLRHLFVDGTKFDDEGLRQLAGFSAIEWLSLANTNITDEGLQHLSELNKLIELDLSGTEMSDAGVEQLAKLPLLEALSLEGTNITDAALMHLDRMPSLRSLSLVNTSVSIKGIQQFDQDKQISIALSETNVTHHDAAKIDTYGPWVMAISDLEDMRDHTEPEDP